MDSSGSKDKMGRSGEKWERVSILPLKLILPSMSLRMLYLFPCLQQGIWWEKSQWGENCTEFPREKTVRKPRGKKRAFYRHCGEIARRFSSLQRESALWASKLFPDLNVLCPLHTDFTDVPLSSFFLQMDHQLRLSYNFSPEVEFRAIRSLTLGKVTGLCSSPHLSNGPCKYKRINKQLLSGYLVTQNWNFLLP